MADYDFDLFVIGGGSGGVRAARFAGDLGARVGLCEESALGGTCVNVGCVPKKLLVYGAHFSQDMADAADYGWPVTISGDHDWPKLIGKKDARIQTLNDIYARLLDNASVTLVRGRGRLTGSHAVEVDGTVYTAANILIAVGGWPVIPDFPGAEHVISSNEVFFLPERPRRVLIVGGGYIGVEFAGIFQGFGSHVTQIYRRDLFLRGFDLDMRTHLAEEMRSHGVDLRFNTDIANVALDGDERVVTLKDGSELRVDCILAAIGRKPLTGDLGLEVAGIQTDARGAIKIDDRYRTNVPSVFAVGDVTDRVQLTPVALAEGMCVARNLFAGMDYTVDYAGIPSAVFSTPTMATVGSTEEEARAAHPGDIAVFTSRFRPMKLSMTSRTERTLCKVVVQKSTDRVLGFHMVGPGAGEIIQGLAVALRCGVTKTQLDTTIGIHPTAAEEFVTLRTPTAE